jgi:hypothetical protein
MTRSGREPVGVYVDVLMDVGVGVEVAEGEVTWM